MQLITGDTPVSDNRHQVMLMASSSIGCYLSTNKRHGTLVLVHVINSNARFCHRKCSSNLLDIFFLCFWFVFKSHKKSLNNKSSSLQPQNSDKNWGKSITCCLFLGVVSLSALETVRQNTFCPLLDMWKIHHQHQLWQESHCFQWTEL